jgi:hypothetical protein
VLTCKLFLLSYLYYAHAMNSLCCAHTHTCTYSHSHTYQRCPGCKCYVERNLGCNVMTCTNPLCKATGATFFCFVCGDRLPGHSAPEHFPRGITSGYCVKVPDDMARAISLSIAEEANSALGGVHWDFETTDPASSSRATNAPATTNPATTSAHTTDQRPVPRQQVCSRPHEWQSPGQMLPFFEDNTVSDFKATW